MKVSDDSEPNLAHRAYLEYRACESYPRATRVLLALSLLSTSMTIVFVIGSDHDWQLAIGVGVTTALLWIALAGLRFTRWGVRHTEEYLAGASLCIMLFGVTQCTAVVCERALLRYETCSACYAGTTNSSTSDCAWKEDALTGVYCSDVRGPPLLGGFAPSGDAGAAFLLTYASWLNFTSFYVFGLGLRFKHALLVTALPGLVNLVLAYWVVWDAWSPVLVAATLGIFFAPGFLTLTIVPWMREALHHANWCLAQRQEAKAEGLRSSRDEALRESELFKERLVVTEAELDRMQAVVDEVMKDDRVWETEMRHFAVRFSDLKFDRGPDSRDVLGEGTFGTVYRGSFLGQTCAIKTLRIQKVEKAALRDFKREVTVMAPLHHANLIELIGACWRDGPDKLALVLEYAARGTVSSLLRGESRWNEQYRLLMEGVAACLVYLHNLSPPVIHRDVKPDNILIDVAFNAKLADFGAARRWEGGNDKREKQTMTMRGTPLYIAPECVARSAYNERADIFSLGVVMFELVVGDSETLQREAKGLAATASHKLIVKTPLSFGLDGSRPSFPPRVLKDYPGVCCLVQKCWAHDMHERPCAEEVLSTLRELRRESAHALIGSVGEESPPLPPVYPSGTTASGSRSLGSGSSEFGGDLSSGRYSAPSTLRSRQGGGSSASSPQCASVAGSQGDPSTPSPAESEHRRVVDAMADEIESLSAKIRMQQLELDEMKEANGALMERLYQ